MADPQQSNIAQRNLETIIAQMHMQAEVLMTQSFLYADDAPMEVRARFQKIIKNMAKAWGVEEVE